MPAQDDIGGQEVENWGLTGTVLRAFIIFSTGWRCGHTAFTMYRATKPVTDVTRGKTWIGVKEWLDPDTLLPKVQTVSQAEVVRTLQPSSHALLPQRPTHRTSNLCLTHPEPRLRKCPLPVADR